MALRQVHQIQSPSFAFETEVRQRVSFRFLVWASLLLGLALLFADNQLKSGFAGDDDLHGEVDGQIAQNEGGNSTRQICYLFVCGAGVVCYRKMRPVRIAWRSPLAGICGALLGWCALSCFWSDDPVSSAKRLLGFLCIAVGAAGFTFVWSRRNIAQWLSLYGTLQVTYGFLNELAFRAFRPWVGDYRFAGTQHENVQAFCCLVTVLASLAAADMTPRFRAIFRLLAVYSGVFLVLTKSRSCILGIAVSVTLYVLLTRPSRNIGWILAVLVVFTFALYMSDVLDPVLNYVSRNGEGLDTLTGRRPLWSLADEFIQRQPLTGYGFQVFWTAEHIEYFSGTFGWQISSAHNGFLESLLTLGYVGMLLHGLTLVCAIVFGGVYYKRTGIALYAFASALFAALFCVGMFESAVIVSVGPYSFGLVLILATLCFEPLLQGVRGELPERRNSFGPQPADLPKTLVKV